MMDNSRESKREFAPLLKVLPRVDDLLKRYSDRRVDRKYMKEMIHEALAHLRVRIFSGDIREYAAAQAFLDEELSDLFDRIEFGSLRRVINGTGVLLHTNLGRAVYDAHGLSEIASHYSNLEFDLATGDRGSRNVHLADFFRILTGCESAIAVNNNAGAVLLVLSALGKGKEVLVSRGEQVEIGGSFRIPEVASLSGAILQEVGTTNKTRISDYERAFVENTGMILKVEPSNFKIVGQAGVPDIRALAELAKEHSVPFYMDLGSGVLEDLALASAVEFEDRSRKDIRLAVQHADLISFSGDKLLGSAQAGIILGKKHLVDLLSKHPLYRALRLDKLSIFALEDTLRMKIRGENSLFEMILAKTAQSLKENVEKFIYKWNKTVNCVNFVNLSNAKGLSDIFSLNPISINSSIGGGTFAISSLESYGVEIDVKGYSSNRLAGFFRKQKYPIIGRQSENRFFIDFRTLLEGDEELLIESFIKLIDNIIA